MDNIQQLIHALTNDHPRHEWHLWEASYFYEGASQRLPRGTWLCHCGAKKRIQHRSLRGKDVTQEELISEAEFEALVRRVSSG